MRFSSLLQAWAATSCAKTQVQEPGADDKYTISSSSIKAQFIRYGSTLTNLFVKDKNGQNVDIVLGYDDPEYYAVDPSHPIYNSVPGRYANRIGHGEYTIDGTTYKTEINDGANTLHSGTNNWSYRTWNVSAVTDNSITFTVRDEPFSSKGMPGLVLAEVTYTVKENEWNIKMDAVSPDVKSPLMLTQHTYFNLDAFKNPDELEIWNHTLYMPYSKRYLVADDGAVPTGEIASVAPNSLNDFASAPYMPLGHAGDLPGFSSNCGTGCEGYNGYFLIEDAPGDAVVLTLARTSENKKVVRSSCVAIEAQDYVDGINHPEWRHREAEISGPGERYSWESS
ncbi:aldose 1-epimerase [Xylaria nigripes]|nr:aldose 1-epimerase [Xylaria nigripes]